MRSRMVNLHAEQAERGKTIRIVIASDAKRNGRVTLETVEDGGWLCSAAAGHQGISSGRKQKSGLARAQADRAEGTNSI